MSTDHLHVVNEDGEVIGEAPREQIHREGLLHKEVHVWFYTPKKELIFQHRAPGAETYPDLLDATVGGHVEVGDTAMRTALKESSEEVGVMPDEDELQLLFIDRTRSEDPVTGRINNVIREVYAYLFAGEPEELTVEVGHGAGFEKRPFEDLKGMSEVEKARFVPSVINAEVPAVIAALE